MPHKEILPFFANYIEKESGIIYAEHNHFQLQNRLEDITRLLGLATLEKLHERAKEGICSQFKQLLIDLATNNETSFFRDPKLFKAIETAFLKPMTEPGKYPGRIKIWSAASSTGQEAHSLSILLTEFNLKNQTSLDFSILGTDISERVLQIAKSSTYSQLEVQRGLPAPYLIKYFQKGADDRWTAKPEITRHLEFRKLNLKDPLPPSYQFQLVLCRNVLIYQTVEAKKEILSRITRTLPSGGFLALGSGESLIGLSTEYEQVSIEGAIIYQKK